MTKAELRALCIFLMYHDNTYEGDCREELLTLANRTAIIYGYLDWIDAYHKL